jgi:O-glycosyl hydrolase
MKRTFSILLLALIALAGCSNNNGSDSPPKAIEVPAGALTLDVLPEDLQAVTGWGIYPGHVFGGEGLTIDKSITAAHEARRVLFEELGINIFRVCLEPQCGENYTAASPALSPAYLDDLAALINDAKNRGITDYLISIWSAPYSMKETYNAGTSSEPNWRGRIKKNQYDLFVAYVKDALLYLQNKGCPLPVALSLQNEPEAGVANGPDDVKASFIDGFDLMTLLTKMRTALNSAGLSAVKLAAPESPSYAGGWIFKWNNTGGALTAKLLEPVDIYMMHSYTGDNYDDNSTAVTGPLNEFLDYKKKIGSESWQTEFSVANNMGVSSATPLGRLTIALRVFSADMIHAGHTVWMWWCGWFPGWRESRPADEQVLLGGNGVTVVTKSPLFDAFATIFNGVPPGSHVRKVATNDPDLKTRFHVKNDLVAFQTENGTFILLINGNDTPKTYYVSGLTGTTGTLKAVSGNDAATVKNSDFTLTGDMARISVPRNSVNFIRTQN